MMLQLMQLLLATRHCNYYSFGKWFFVVETDQQVNTAAKLHSDLNLNSF